MIGERENNFNESNYGTLVMRPYNISGNDIDAFYDANDNLVFVLDNTINATKPNVLLVINPDGDKKWDEILSGEYGVDLETIRPKLDNKYQKLDIEYSGLSVYENLITAYSGGDSVADAIEQLNVLRNSATRHSAMTRLNVANEIIARTNVTIVKTKESIVRLETKLKTLRSKLADLKKEVGRVAPKQSAAKILKTESQIDATKEKIKRAQKRLESAEKRLENATVDAKLASDLLNQPGVEIKQPVKSQPVTTMPDVLKMVAPDYDNDDVDDDDDDIEEKIDEQETSDIKPLFDKDPEIINNEIAFKPITFDEPDLPIVAPAPELPATLSVPNSDEIEAMERGEEKTEVAQPVLESLTPIMDKPLEISETQEETTVEQPWNLSDDFDAPSETPTFDEPVVDQDSDIVETDENVAPIDVQPVPAVNEENRPMSPMSSEVTEHVVEMVPDDTKKTKSSFLYYLLLLILIAASVFALWTYQKNMGNTKPLLSIGEKTAVVAPVENVTAPMEPETPALQQPVEEDAFVDEIQTPVADEKPTEPVVEDNEPYIMDVVSEKISAFSNFQNEPDPVVDENPIVHEPVVNKPVYGAGAKHEEMFVYEDDNVEDLEYDEEYAEPGYYPTQSQVIYSPNDEVFVDTYDEVVYPEDVYEDDGFYYDYDYDPEEAAYQAGDDGYDEYR